MCESDSRLFLRYPTAADLINQPTGVLKQAQILSTS